ncbi:hypothetical protein [Sphingomonas sp. PR090111-T3T-6A]|uniref:hypothetical protein n=1 Tax=Sphingomonas sp. PR090111-T3T-6A TaxID=685778 RepID=UPI00036E6D1F|nr:hypothetical protein [Sphingomonas sp. PR090111-T3T-6A]
MPNVFDFRVAQQDLIPSEASAKNPKPHRASLESWILIGVQSSIDILSDQVELIEGCQKLEDVPFFRLDAQMIPVLMRLDHPVFEDVRHRFLHV